VLPINLIRSLIVEDDCKSERFQRLALPSRCRITRARGSINLVSQLSKHTGDWGGIDYFGGAIERVGEI